MKLEEVAELKEGDLILAYKRGLHKVIKIQEVTGRGYSGPVVWYKPVTDNKGNTLKPDREKDRKEYTCYFGYCTKLTEARALRILKEEYAKYKQWEDSITQLFPGLDLGEVNGKRS